VRTASAAATIVMADWVRSMSRRRSKASATTPPASEKAMIGTTRTSPTRPSAIPFRSGGTRSETCQRIAAVCIIEPEKETSCPLQRRRKLRCWRARKGEGVRTIGGC
jgi:hypothetical protein